MKTIKIVICLLAINLVSGQLPGGINIGETSREEFVIEMISDSSKIRTWYMPKVKWNLLPNLETITINTEDKLQSLTYFEAFGKRAEEESGYSKSVLSSMQIAYTVNYLETQGFKLQKEPTASNFIPINYQENEGITMMNEELEVLILILPTQLTEESENVIIYMNLYSSRETKEVEQITPVMLLPNYQESMQRF